MMNPAHWKLSRGIIWTVAALSLFTAGCSGNPNGTKTDGKQIPPEKIVAKVNDVALTTDEFETYLSNPELPLDVRKDIVNEWVETELLFQEAIRLGLDKDPEIARQIREVEQYVLSTEILRLNVESQVHVSDAELRDYYETHPAEYRREQREAHVLGMSFFDLETAQKVYDKIKQGADFDQVMRDYDGQDFGYITEDWEISPEIAERAFQLQAGELAPPIETDFGIHLIKVVDIQEAGSPRQFEDIKAELKEQLANEKYHEVLSNYLNELRTKAKVTIDYDKIR